MLVWSPSATRKQSSSLFPEWLALTTHVLARELGPGYEREVIHRDDLVVF